MALSSAFKAWLNSTDAKTPVLLLHIYDVWNDGSGSDMHYDSATGDLRFASRPHRTGSSDTPASWQYEQRLVGDVGITASIGEISLTGEPRPSLTLSDISLDNRDRGLNDLKDPAKYALDGREFEFILGDESWAHSDFEVIFAGVIEQIILSGLEIRLRARDLAEKLDIPLQPYTFISGASQGKSIPVSVGYIKDFQPPIEDDSTGKRRLHHGPIQSIEEVKVDGEVKASGWSEDLAEGTITWKDPGGDLVVTFKGATSGGSWVSDPAGIIEYLVTRESTFRQGQAQAGSAGSITLAADDDAADDEHNGRTITLDDGQSDTITDYDAATKVATISGTFSPAPDAETRYQIDGATTRVGALAASEIDSAAFSAVAAEISPEAGRAFAGSGSLRAAMNSFAADIRALHKFELDGKLSLMRWSAPSAGGLAIGPNELRPRMQMAFARRPAWRIRLGVGRNHAPRASIKDTASDGERAEAEKEFELAQASDASIKGKHPMARDPERRATNLRTVADGNTAAAYDLTLFGEQRRMFFPECYMAPLQIRIGDDIELTDNFNGLDAEPAKVTEWQARILGGINGAGVALGAWG